MSTSKFMSGYEETRESLMVSMRALTRLMDKGSNKVYTHNNGQVSRESVEKPVPYTHLTLPTNREV